ncbi:MAG: hypothetical protein ACRCWF_03320 [Beijerinckiaceae bacterium]
MFDRERAARHGLIAALWLALAISLPSFGAFLFRRTSFNQFIAELQGFGPQTLLLCVVVGLFIGYFEATFRRFFGSPAEQCEFQIEILSNGVYWFTVGFIEGRHPFFEWRDIGDTVFQLSGPVVLVQTDIGSLKSTAVAKIHIEDARKAAAELGVGKIPANSLSLALQQAVERYDARLDEFRGVVRAVKT